MDETLLKKYADFVVRVGVNVQPGQTMLLETLTSPEALAFARDCARAAYEAGARDVILKIKDEPFSRIRHELASEEALCDIKPYELDSVMQYVDAPGGVCRLVVDAMDPNIFAGLDSGKINRVTVARMKAMQPWREIMMKSEFQWTIAAVPSRPWAKQVFPDLPEEEAMEKLWQVIFDVCRVTGGDPVSAWQEHVARLCVYRDKMNELQLESVHFKSSNGTDLTVGLADQAVWCGANEQSLRGGYTFLANIPTEEVFTAPHREKVDGVVYGTKPYVYNGQTIDGWHVTFEKGRVVEYGAAHNAELFGQLLDTDEGSRHIGEVALVPVSSPINQSGLLFYNTLFDENAACHIAFGASYPTTTVGGDAMTEEELLARGMNQSANHEDVMIGAADTEITGLTKNGETVLLFQNGEWVL